MNADFDSILKDKRKKLNFNCDKCFYNEICRYSFPVYYSTNLTTERMLEEVAFEENNGKIDCNYYKGDNKLYSDEGEVKL